MLVPAVGSGCILVGARKKTEAPDVPLRGVGKPLSRWRMPDRRPAAPRSTPVIPDNSAGKTCLLAGLASMPSIGGSS